MKKLSLSVLSILLLLIQTAVFPIVAEDGDFDYTYNCISHYSKENEAACRLYQQELTGKADDLDDKLDNIKSQLKEVKKDINRTMEKINEYNSEIEVIEQEMFQLETGIADLEVSISSLEAEIDQHNSRIGEIDDNIRERMVALQSFMYVNNYIDFLVGATSFIDLIRRIEALNDIQSYDNTLMEELNKEIYELNIAKEEVEREKLVLEENKATIEKEKAYIEGLVASAEELMMEYNKQEAELEAKEQSLLEDLSDVKADLKAISSELNNVVSSGKWTNPIPSGHASSSTWHYPASFGGGVHLGVDIAGVSIGTTIRAVANGYVLYSSNECSTNGYLGCSCGKPGSSGGGNQVYLLVSVDEKTYAVKYLHLKKDTAISKGQIVSAGDKIGEVGSSGNSSGKHCHVEITYLGTKSISYYAENWDGDFAFGCKWGSAALNYTCENRDNKAPCRLEPRPLLGIEW